MPVLFEKLSDTSVRGKLDGKGAWRLLESRWSSVRAVKADIDEGMVPVKEVSDKSRSLRDDWREELELRAERGLFRFWPLTIRF